MTTPARAVRLDVRQLPTWQRHPMIFAAFDNLREGEALVLINDHEPRPLRLQFEELRAGRFRWTPRNLGNDHWEVEIRPTALDATEPILSTLQRSSLFCDTAPAILARFAEAAISQRLSRGAVVMQAGEPWPYIGLVCEGTLAVVSTSAQGREHLLYEVLPLEAFGELAAIDNGATFANATVISRKALIALIPRAGYLEAFEADPGLARAVARDGAQRLRQLVERSTAQVSQSTLARIAAAILPYASCDRGMAEVLPPLDVLSLGDLAIAAGTVREVVGRALPELERDQAIERVRGRIVRVDRERLSAFV